MLVGNVTDINDKIYDAARAAGGPRRSWRTRWPAITSPTRTGSGSGRPDAEPYATEYVGQIIELIQRLVDGGSAYAVSGDVYFRVRKLDSYGELSRRDLDQMDQGEGVEGADLKEDPLDFALWKATKEGEDTSWDSPWGAGRPGWHIECSAMAEALLGVEFDIHGGGIDLVFPHHENEAAQTLAARGKPLARTLDAQRDARAGLREDGEVGREHPWARRGARRRRRRRAGAVPELRPLPAAAGVLRRAAGGREALGGADPRRGAAADVRPVAGRAGVPHRDAFFDALRNDFNTAEALASLYGWIREANRSEEPVGDAHLREMLDVLGLVGLLAAEEGPPEEAVELAALRDQARRDKDWAEADRLRDELRAHGLGGPRRAGRARAGAGVMSKRGGSRGPGRQSAGRPGGGPGRGGPPPKPRDGGKKRGGGAPSGGPGRGAGGGAPSGGPSRGARGGDAAGRAARGGDAPGRGARGGGAPGGAPGRGGPAGRRLRSWRSRPVTARSRARVRGRHERRRGSGERSSTRRGPPPHGHLRPQPGPGGAPGQATRPSDLGHGGRGLAGQGVDRQRRGDRGARRARTRTRASPRSSTRIRTPTPPPCSRPTTRCSSRSTRSPTRRTSARSRARRRSRARPG